MKKDQKKALNSFNRRNGWDQRTYGDNLIKVRDKNQLNMPFDVSSKGFLGHNYAFVCKSHIIGFNEYGGKTVNPSDKLLQLLNEMNSEMTFKELVESYDIYRLWGDLQRNYGFRMSDTQRTVPKALIRSRELIFNPYVLFDTYQCVDDGSKVKIFLQKEEFGEIFGSLMFKSDFGVGLALPLKCKKISIPLIDLSDYKNMTI